MNDFFKRQNELAKYRKIDAKKLKTKLINKLAQVQKLTIHKINDGEKELIFEINSYADAAIFRYKGIVCGDPLEQARFNHYDHMDYDFDNCIPDFYREQIKIIDKWIEMLKKG